MKFARFTLVALLALLTADLASAQCGAAFGSRLRSVGSRLRAPFGMFASAGAYGAGSCGASATAGACFSGSDVLTAPAAAGTPVAAPGAKPAFFYDLVRIHVAKAGVKAGLSRVESHAQAASLTNAVIDGMLLETRTAGPAGGSFLDWLTSPAGQAFIAMLLAMFMK